MDEKTIKQKMQRLYEFALKLGLYFRDLEIYIHSSSVHTAASAVPTFTGKEWRITLTVAAPIEEII